MHHEWQCLTDERTATDVYPSKYASLARVTGIKSRTATHSNPLGLGGHCVSYTHTLNWPRGGLNHSWFLSFSLDHGP